MYNKTGNLVWRRIGLDDDNQHYKPIEELDNGIGQQASEYWNVIMQSIQVLRDTWGMNEATDSFTGDRTYGAAVEAAIESTNNALYGIIETDYNIMKSVSNDVLLRVQSGVRAGNQTNT